MPICSATLLDLKAEEKQQLLEADPLLKKLELVHSLLTREVSVLELKGKIESQAQQEMTDAQKQYYLRQQMKAIQDELGEGEGNETKDLRARIAQAKLPAHVQTVADREVDRLGAHGPGLARVPDDPDLSRLDPRAAVGQRSPRIASTRSKRAACSTRITTISTRSRNASSSTSRCASCKGDMKGPILCFVGPPGVGKTSLGQSIARAMQRKFVRISLGGVRDEAEIRGHRRTYIGSMPGRIVQALKQAGSANPGLHARRARQGQRSATRAIRRRRCSRCSTRRRTTRFRDHYLEVPFDLSKVLFIATANQIGPVHPALRDRMEIV